MASLSAIETTAQATAPGLYIEIDPQGLSHIVYNTSLYRGLNTVSLPVRPIDYTIDVSCRDTVPEWVYSTGVLYVSVSINTTCLVSYIADTSFSNGVFTLYINYSGVARLAYPSSVYLLRVPREIIGYQRTENTTVIDFVGPEEVSYTLVVPVTTTTPTTTPVATVYTTAVQTTTPSPATTIATTATIYTQVYATTYYTVVQTHTTRVPYTTVYTVVSGEKSPTTLYSTAYLEKTIYSYHTIVSTVVYVSETTYTVTGTPPPSLVSGLFLYIVIAVIVLLVLGGLYAILRR